MKKSGEKGQVLVITALWLMLLLAFIGLVVDGGIMAVHYRRAQAVVDLAAQAASHAVDVQTFWSTNRVVINPSWAAQRAQQVVAANGVRRDGTPLVTGVQVHVTPNAVRVSGTAHIPTFFMKVFGIRDVRIRVVSVAYPAYGIEWEGQ